MQGTEFLIVLGSGAFLMGLAVIIWISVTKQRGYGTPNWPLVAGHMQMSKVVKLERETPDGMVSTFTPVVKYQYEIDGAVYVSGRLNFLPDEYGTFEDRRLADQIVSSYPSGATVDVFYNPANPKQASLVVPKPVAHNVVLSFGVTCLIAGALTLSLGIVLL